MFVYLSGWYGTIYSVHQRIHPAPERWALEWIVWYSPPCTRVPDTVRSVPECLVQSTLYQRGWYSPPCTREMSEPRWTSERSSLDVNTVTTGTVFNTLSTATVFYRLYNVQCVNSLGIWWLRVNSLMYIPILNMDYEAKENTGSNFAEAKTALASYEECMICNIYIVQSNFSYQLQM